MDLYSPINLFRFGLFLLFLPLWIALWIIAQLRPGFYQRGWIKAMKAEKPVISIGNLTLGGTGKSPMSSALIEHFEAQGKQMALLSRGYGVAIGKKETRVLSQEEIQGGPEYYGDEPWMLYQRHGQASFWIGPSRKLSAQKACKSADLLILDDGYQHLKLQRDLNLLLVDGDRWFGNDRLVPLGPLREPLSAIERADCLILTKSEPGRKVELQEKLKAHDLQPLCFESEFKAELLVGEDGRTQELEALMGAKVILASGIANPKSFEETVKGFGAIISEHLIFHDHQDYLKGDADWIYRSLKAHPDHLLVCTEKDFEKLRMILDEGTKFWFLKMKVQLEPQFWDWLDSNLEKLQK